MSIQRESGRKVVLEKFYDLSDEICYFYECRDSVNYGVAAVQPAASECPPDIRNKWFESPQKKKAEQERCAELGGRVSRFVY